MPVFFSGLRRFSTVPFGSFSNAALNYEIDSINENDFHFHVTRGADFCYLPNRCT
jgi:hypothetical protein